MHDSLAEPEGTHIFLKPQTARTVRGTHPTGATATPKPVPLLGNSSPYRNSYSQKDHCLNNAQQSSESR